jgi:hypothetical protein
MTAGRPSTQPFRPLQRFNDLPRGCRGVQRCNIRFNFQRTHLRANVRENPKFPGSFLLFPVPLSTFIATDTQDNIPNLRFVKSQSASRNSVAAKFFPGERTRPRVLWLAPSPATSQHSLVAIIFLDRSGTVQTTASPSFPRVARHTEGPERGRTRMAPGKRVRGSPLGRAPPGVTCPKKSLPSLASQGRGGGGIRTTSQRPKTSSTGLHQTSARYKMRAG